MQKIRLAIAVIILIALIITSFYINSKSNSRTYASGVDVTDNFKDENLKNAIIELAEEATKDIRAQIATSNLEIKNLIYTIKHVLTKTVNHGITLLVPKYLYNFYITKN